MNHYRITIRLEGDSEYEMEWCEKMLAILADEAESWCGIQKRMQDGVLQTKDVRIVLWKPEISWHKVGENTP